MFDRFLHKILGIPYKLHVAADIRRKNERATMVFLHGIAASSRTWDGLLKEIKKDDSFKNVRLISLDLLGFGRSPAPNWNRFGVSDQIRAIRRTLNSLFIPHPLYIVGHSMGSLLAAEYASAYSGTQSLILISPPFMTPKEQRIPIDTLYAAMLDNLKKAATSKSGKKVAGVVEKFSNFEAKYTNMPVFKRSMDNVVLKGHAWNEAHSLDIPIMLVHGTFDSVVSRGNLVKLAKLPNITLAESANGHSVSPRRIPFIIKQLKRALEP
jgi:pimeloyl-ACP methyl ester carboxylesterase